MAFNVKKVKPLFNGVITTAKKYAYDEADSGIVLMNKMEGQINPFQWVVAKGRMCAEIEEGDIVKLNFNRYLKVKHTPGVIEDSIQKDSVQGYYEFPTVEIDGEQYLFMQYNDIEYVVTDYDGIEGGGLLQ